MPIDTRVPAWLQQNWAPRQPVDPTPWLQERYRRQERQQEISLRVQEFGVRAQANELAIQRQALLNEQVSMEIATEREETPLLAAQLKMAGSDPTLTLKHVQTSFRSAKVRERALAARKAAADSAWMQNKTKFDTELIAKAADLIGKGVLIEPRDDGTFDPREVQTAAEAFDKREQVQALDLRKASLSPSDRPQSTLGKLLADRDAALKSGDKVALAAYDAEIAQRQTKDGIEVTTNPDGTVVVRQGKMGDLTIANRTKAQSSLTESIQSINVANRLEPLIDSDTVGAKAFVESWVKDRVLAQAFPEMASSKRATAESLAAQLRSSAIRELKSDGNIAENERRQILEAIPDVNAPIDSPARAKQLVRDIRRMSALHAVVSAGKLGQPVPKSAAQVFDAVELKRLVETGVITKEQALEIFDAQ